MGIGVIFFQPKTSMLFGDASTITGIIYMLIGLAGLYKILLIATKK